MLQFRSKMTASAVAVALGLSLVAVAPAVAADKAPAAKTAAKAVKKKATKKKTKKAAAPRTVTACVNNKSGATKVLLGKKAKRKCAKGWTKMTWNVAGPQGAAGKNGVNGVNGVNGGPGANGAHGANGAVSVRDATGKRIGGFGGYSSLMGTFSLLQVIADDGGVYTYLDSVGKLFPILGLSSGGSPLFLDAGCAGQAYFPSGSMMGSGASELLGGSFRFAYRPFLGMSLLDLGPTRAWKLTTSVFVVPAVVPPVYQLGPTGGCGEIVDNPATPTSEIPIGPSDALLKLDPAIAPPDGVGPLTIG